MASSLLLAAVRAIRRLATLRQAIKQHASGRGQQHVQRSLVVLHGVVEHGAARDHVVNGPSGMVDLDLPLHGIQLGQESGDGGFGQQTRNRQKLVIVKGAHEFGRRLVAHRRPDLQRVSGH